MASRQTRRAGRASTRAESPVSLENLQEIVAPTRATPRQSQLLPPIASRKSNAYGAGISVLPREWNTRLNKSDLGDALDILVNTPGPAPSTDHEVPGPSQAETDKDTASVAGWIAAFIPQLTVIASTVRRSARVRNARSTRSTRSTRRTAAQATPHQPVDDSPWTPLDRQDSIPSMSFATESAIFNNADYIPRRDAYDLRQPEFDLAHEPVAELPEVPELSQHESPQPELSSQPKHPSPTPKPSLRDIAVEQIQRFGHFCTVHGSTISAVVIGTLLAVTMALLLATASSFGGIRHYGDLSHNIGQFVPYFIAHPMSAMFNPDDMVDLQKRLASVEYDVAYLKHKRELHQDSIVALERLLPDFISLKKDSRGNVEVPVEFWNALKSKMMADHSFINSIGFNTIGARPNDAQEQARMPGQSWNDFLALNQRKLDAWMESKVDDEWDRHLQKAFRGDVLLSKAEFLSLLDQKYADVKDSSAREIADLVGHLERDIQTLRQDTAKRLSKSDVDEYKARASVSQIVGFSRASVERQISLFSGRMNFLSQRAGAIVDPMMTSPTYDFPALRAGWWKRTALWALDRPFPIPNPPAEALRSWSEHGDCWCSPARTRDEGALTLSVLLSHSLYPEEVVIEHISPEATLDYRSAPRDMELLAYVEGWQNQRAVVEYSDKFFGWTDPDTMLDENWLRIANWTYDVLDGGNVQLFSVQLPLKELNVPVRKVVVRAKNNWGKEDYTCLYRVRLHGTRVDPANDPYDLSQAT